MKKSFLRSTALALLVLLSQASAFSQENNIEKPQDGFARLGNEYPDALVPMTTLERKLFADVTGLLTRAQNRKPGTPGYLPNVSGASLWSVKDYKKGDILVNLDRSLIGESWGAEIEEFLDPLRYAVEDVAGKRVKKVGSVMFIFNGKDPAAYDPAVPQPSPLKQDAPSDAPTPLAATGPVVVSAGHGLYYHYGFKDWRAQRNPSNGLIEDYMTPLLATPLRNFLTNRSRVTSYLVRQSTVSTEIHEPSGQRWWRVAARYYLQKILPDNKEIWHSLPNATYALREYDEDIRSRPLYANHLGATTLLSIHTNANDNAALSGTRVYYNNALATATSNQKLAASLSCYMRELITAVDKYKTFKVGSPVVANDKGEIRLAKMPAAIVEVAFHTNAGDAAALKDSAFRLAAMKGVEKGLRLYNQNQPCKPFAITSIPSATGPHNMPFPVTVNYAGFPQFVVKAEVEIVSCPAGWDCHGGTITYSKQTPTPLKFDWTCTTSDPSQTVTTGIQTTLIDVDGVKTKTVPSSVICTPGAATAPTANGPNSSSISLQ
ncbi:MAG TPA: N-acetylmuramoyl-L-alanine amidase [Pyrinomonadaceae bacterium]|nr:N-acetylmuramoyl-L-alanine amidase [Pyrinomonadaceae bacterium]